MKGKKRLRTATAGLCAAAVLLSTGYGAAPVYAQEETGNEGETYSASWEEVSALLDENIEIYDWSVNSTTAVKVLDKDCQMEKADNNRSKMTLQLVPEETVYMVAAVEGGKDSETYYEDAVSKVLEYDNAEKIEAANDRHQEWWKEYWMKSYLDLDEDSASLEYAAEQSTVQDFKEVF